MSNLEIGIKIFIVWVTIVTFVLLIFKSTEGGRDE